MLPASVLRSEPVQPWIFKPHWFRDGPLWAIAVCKHPPSSLSYAASMQIALAIYFASALGAIAVWLLMPSAIMNLRKLGGLVGLATLGGLWLFLALGPTWQHLGIGQGPFVYYYLFSSLAIIAAVRVICNEKPIYSALWFVMVVLATAGLFLVLSAEFIAFAMVIIYGGAILVTYMFVIMLASHAGYAENPSELPMYDRFAREPFWASLAGFLLLATLLGVIFIEDRTPNPDAVGISNQQIILGDPATGTGPILGRRPATDLAHAIGASAATLPPAAKPESVTNAERIGIDLFLSHPLGLELAGVILLVSLVGAVVIAKTRVPNEDTQTENTASASEHVRSDPAGAAN